MHNVSLISRHRISLRFRYCCFLAALAGLIFIGGGCSTYQNITGYFNTYYNAKKLFDEAVNDVELASQKTRDTLYFAEYKIGPAQEQKFDKVIEKCSKIIQSYEKSAWVDNAILMIGISYVYKNESESAERKFRELLDNFPQSDLRRQAKLWFAKSEYFMGKSESALKLTTELFDEARGEGDNDVLFEVLMLDAQIANDRNEYDVAAQKYILASQLSVSDNLRSHAQYQLAITYEKLNNWGLSAEAYRGVAKFHPPFSLEFQSRLKCGRMLTQSHQYDKALTVLDDLFDDQLKTDERSLVDLEIANTHWARGDSADAFALYNLIDTVYSHTDASARASYQRGLIYEQSLFDFKTARDFYSRSKDQYAQSEAVPLAQKKSATLNEYFRHYQDIAKFDSLYTARTYRDSVMLHTAALSPPDSLFSGGLHLDSLTAKSIDVHRDTLNHTAVAGTSHPDTLVAVHRDSLAVAPRLRPQQVLPDSLSQALANAPDENFDNEDDQTEGRHHGRTKEHLRNELIADSLVGRNTAALPQKGKNLQRPKPVVNDSIKVKNKTTTSANTGPTIALSADSLQSLQAQAKFELGGVLLLQLQLPDSALTWFNRVVQNHPKSPIIPRTLYTMAEIYRSKSDTVMVDSIYHVLITGYGNSEYARQAKRILGMQADSTLRETIPQECQSASQFLQDRKPEDALHVLQQFALEHPGSPYRAKALYTIGWIYENEFIKNDSAAVWYKQLVKEYPASIYASEVQPKLAVKSDPKSLSQYVKINEIVPLQPVKPDRTRTKARRAQDKGNQDEEDIRNRRNHEGDDEDQDDEPDEPDEDVDDNNIP